MRRQRVGIGHRTDSAVESGSGHEMASLHRKLGTAAKFFSVRSLGSALVAVFVVLKAATAIAASGSSATDPAKEPNGPRIAIENPTVDAGDVMENGVVSHDFVVRNVGSAPLTIEQVRPG